MLRHRTDVVAFVFATFFLVCAGLAIGVRTGNLGLGASTPDGAWIAGTVLAIAGAIGVVGTVSSVRRDRLPAGPTPSPTLNDEAAPTEATAELDDGDLVDGGDLVDEHTSTDVLDEVDPAQA